MESLNECVTMGLLVSKTAEADFENVVVKCLNKEEPVKETELDMGENVVDAPVSAVLVSPLTALQDLTREYQEIDTISSKSTSLSEVEEGQILDSSSDASDLTKEIVKKKSNILSQLRP